MATSGAALREANGARSRRQRAISWIAVAAWGGVILGLGGDPFSASETSRFLGPLLHWLYPDAGPELLASAQFALRKTAHVIEYGILGLLGFRAFQLSFDRAQASIAAASLGLVLALAILDESRQALSAERSGAVSDVALDLSGAVGMLGLAAVIRRRRAPAAE